MTIWDHIKVFLLRTVALTWDVVVAAPIFFLIGLLLQPIMSLLFGWNLRTTICAMILTYYVFGLCLGVIVTRGLNPTVHVMTDEEKRHVKERIEEGNRRRIHGH